jgi:hypothetical protein
MVAKPKRMPRKAGGAAVARTETRIFRVALQRKRSVWREIEIRSHHSLYDLADSALQAFGFDFDHAFGFYSGSGQGLYRANPRYELFTDLGEPTDEHALGVEKTSVATAFPQVGHRMTLLFDYGDECLFDVKLTGIERAEPHMRYPRLLRQGGTAPEQYPSFDDDE